MEKSDLKEVLEFLQEYESNLQGTIEAYEQSMFINSMPNKKDDIHSQEIYDKAEQLQAKTVKKIIKINELIEKVKGELENE